MSERSTTRFNELQRRYRERDMPWDHELPPPEILALVDRLPAGRALDLGCGTARACVYLARHGWQVDGVDFIPEALELAAERVRGAGVTELVRLHQGSVTDMAFLTEPFDLVIDVGCMHGFAGDELIAYAAEVARLTRPDGLYLLFAHLREHPEEQGGASLPAGTVEALFSSNFEFMHVELGVTVVRDIRWTSAWYELRRRSA